MSSEEIVSASGWDFWIDAGGTFTDCLGRDRHGKLHRAKVLSSSAIRGCLQAIGNNNVVVKFSSNYPKNFFAGFRFQVPKKEMDAQKVRASSSSGKIEIDGPLPSNLKPGDVCVLQFDGEAPELGARVIARIAGNEKLPHSRLRIATTKGTNALLEKKGARTVLFINKGLGDLLFIHTQQRPDIFALDIQRPDPLHEAVVEVEMDSNSELLLNDDFSKQIDSLRNEGFEVAAVCLMHSYQSGENEVSLADYLRQCGFSTIICSHRTAPFMKILPRAETTLVDAYLSPLLDSYLDRLVSEFGSLGLSVMTSAGGLVPRSSYRACDSLFSGPAGGVVGAVQSGVKAGIQKLIGFDMGGTSTDVARYDGALSYQFETRVGCARILAPSLKIETVAAGGGSICLFDGERLRVGPESAGAEPGPACYGNGGPLTITDVNLLLGRIDPDQFGIPISGNSSQLCALQLSQTVSGFNDLMDGLLSGLLDIANENMTDAIRKISTAEGYDPSDYALIAFGGAGGQHACGIAENLEISKILFPSDAGLLSANGLCHAVPEAFAAQQILCSFSEFEKDAEDLVQMLAAEATEKLHPEDRDNAQLSRRIVSIRLRAQESAIDVDWMEEPLLASYENLYLSIFGYEPNLSDLEVVSIRVIVSLPGYPVEEETFQSNGESPQPFKTQRSFSDGKWCDAGVYHREKLQTGDAVSGPAIVQDPFSTLFIDKGWSAIAGDQGSLLVELAGKSSARNLNTDEVEIELFSNRFQTLVEDMGVRLMRTAVSTNVKDRLDFSCGLLDAEGGLVVNAPHIPVHLGSLGMCVKTVSMSHDWKRGEMVITNHPGFGGSHLPDVTIICPIFSDTEELLGFLVNRAHHAELGGVAPGSMPPAAASLAEEGVVIPPMRVMVDNHLDLKGIEVLLTDGPFPSRRVQENLSDLKAQVAANLKGLDDMRKMIQAYGSSNITHFMKAIQDRAEQSLRSKLLKQQDGEYASEQRLDDGTLLRVVATVEKDEMNLKFFDGGGVHSGNFNATPGIVYSVVVYFLRVWLSEPMPLNDGLLRPVEIEIDEGILNPPFAEDPFQCPPVVAGNVETSQRLVDTLLLLFETVACSQGTMNNLIFGNDRVSFYETIAGGSGAGDSYTGESGVHVHMTNTGITDPEILEHLYPVKLKRFAIRINSGGRGKFSGGDGVIRELEFTESVTLSLLTQHRIEAPYGLNGGEAGKTGEQWLLREGCEPRSLNPFERLEVQPGDRLRILTPGGGGWGAA